MNTAVAFYKVWNHVRQEAFYLPRTAPTVGGMWTVDTWQRDGITAQLMDEGWTQVIRTEMLHAIQSGSDPVVIKQGTADDLVMLARKISA
jgi:hypothetical protein